MVKRKFTEKNIFLCIAAYRCDAPMNHTENMPLEIKEHNVYTKNVPQSSPIKKSV